VVIFYTISPSAASKIILDRPDPLSGADFPRRATLRKKSQKFLKKVLILLKSGCIM
jgi:hypothetical protein